jgi:hypothetical protein
LAWIAVTAQFHQLAISRARMRIRVQSQRGPAGKPASDRPIIGWRVDAENSRIVPFQSDGQPGPAVIDLRPMLEKFLARGD